eukprot:TRINITY_DN1338_c0_g1_i8.p1 TRINITY_DN1338_c0_g1~~TRINITY_DN1338_c0_g1_i8.p1  ORF type:complete len:106 (-),score=11.27 TRINITY_DN1338_c0_g1_i8:69-386(-)
MWFTQSSPSFVRQPNLKNQGLPLKTKINVIETFENYEQAIKVLDEIQRAVKNAGVLPDSWSTCSSDFSVILGIHIARSIFGGVVLLCCHFGVEEIEVRKNTKDLL